MKNTKRKYSQMMRKELIDKFEDLVKDQILENKNEFLKIYGCLDKCDQNIEDLETHIKLNENRFQNKLEESQKQYDDKIKSALNSFLNHKKEVDKNVSFISEYKEKIENEINDKISISDFETVLDDLKIEILEKFSFDKGRMEGLSCRISQNQDALKKLESHTYTIIQDYLKDVEKKLEKSEKDIESAKVDFNEVDTLLERFDKKIFVMNKHIEYLMNRLKRLENKE